MRVHNFLWNGGRACGLVTQAAASGIATAGARIGRVILRSVFSGSQARHTANAAAELECSEMVTPNAVTLAAAPGDGWYLISALGEFAAPEPQQHCQVFGRDQAREVVSTFNSISGKAARCIKNLWHGFGPNFSIPIFEGHSDRDPKRWPTMNRLGEISDLRADDSGLWGLVTWNAAGLAKRTREFGPLKPSPIFWHEAKDDQGRVFPALLESVGLVRQPNIPSAPMWTQNAATTFASPDALQPDTQNMSLKIIAAALGLPETAVETDITTKIEGIVGQARASASALSTANAAKEKSESDLTTLQTQLTTANSQVTTITGERDALKSERDALSTANATLITGILDLAEKKGAITPAEREAYKGKLSTANSAAATATELQTRKAMNVAPVEINGNRIDLSTANARQGALEAAVNKRMAADKTDWSTAYAAVKADPTYAPLFAAMADPTRSKS